MVAAWLAAGTPDFNKNADAWQVLWITLILMAILTAAALLIAWIGRWMKKPVADLSSTDELTRFRLLYESGELGREEYERIKAKLVPRMRKELDLPPAPPKDNPPAELAPEAVKDARFTNRQDRPPAGPQDAPPAPPGEPFR